MTQKPTTLPDIHNLCVSESFLNTPIPDGRRIPSIHWEEQPHAVAAVQRWMSANGFAQGGAKDADCEKLFKLFNLDDGSCVYNAENRTTLRKRLLRKANDCMKSAAGSRSAEVPEMAFAPTVNTSSQSQPPFRLPPAANTSYRSQQSSAPTADSSSSGLLFAPAVINSSRSELSLTPQPPSTPTANDSTRSRRLFAPTGNKSSRSKPPLSPLASNSMAEPQAGKAQKQPDEPTRRQVLTPTGRKARLVDACMCSVEHPRMTDHQMSSIDYRRLVDRHMSSRESPRMADQYMSFRESYDVAITSEQECHDDLVALYDALRASASPLTNRASVDAEAKRLRHKLAEWTLFKLEAYHELEMSWGEKRAARAMRDMSLEDEASFD